MSTLGLSSWGTCQDVWALLVPAREINMIVPGIDTKNNPGRLTRISGTEFREEMLRMRCVLRDHRSEDVTHEYTGKFVISPTGSTRAGRSHFWFIPAIFEVVSADEQDQLAVDVCTAPWQ